jgi:hypothetical protein
MTRGTLHPGVVRCPPYAIASRRLNAFSDTASLEQIQEQINARRAEVRPLERHIEWLEDLLARRTEHVANGGNPPRGYDPA